MPLFRSCGLSAPARSHEPCSLGFHRVCLICRCPCSRPLPVRKRTFGQPAPTGRRVPLSWFLTTSTACSGCSFAGLLHPATSIRFVAFPASLPANCRIASDNRWGLPGRLPRRRFSHPSEFSPRQQPHRVTHLLLPVSAPKHRGTEIPKCFNPSTSGLGGSPEIGSAGIASNRTASTAVALMTFPLVRLAAFHDPVARTASSRDLPESAAFKALLHCRVRCETQPLLTAPRSLLPWAWFPSKVFHRCRSGLASAVAASREPPHPAPNKSDSKQRFLRSAPKTSTARSAWASARI